MIAALLAAGGLALAAQAAPANPCLDPALHLRCPDLIAERPTNLSVERSGGRTRLRMENRIVNVGLGPAELFSNQGAERLTRPARQVITDTRGVRHRYTTGALLAWTKVPTRGGSYWKWRDALRMELWSLDARGAPVALRRLSPKLNYCLRDLRRLRSGSRVPAGPHFGACNQRYDQPTLTLGTSVGWADIYPASYPGNFIDVTGLRGCFAAIHRVDPKDVVHERTEHDNAGVVVVRLPYRRGPQHCPRYAGT